MPYVMNTPDGQEIDSFYAVDKTAGPPRVSAMGADVTKQIRSDMPQVDPRFEQARPVLTAARSGKPSGMQAPVMVERGSTMQIRASVPQARKKAIRNLQAMEKKLAAERSIMRNPNILPGTNAASFMRRRVMQLTPIMGQRDATIRARNEWMQYQAKGTMTMHPMAIKAADASPGEMARRATSILPVPPRPKPKKVYKEDITPTAMVPQSIKILAPPRQATMKKPQGRKIARRRIRR